MPKIVSPSFTIESEIDGKKILRESQAPENKKFHWDNSVESATRGHV